MKRMTTDNPQLNIERLLNTARAENNQAVLHLGDEVITLTEYVDKCAKERGCDITQESVMDGDNCMECDCPVAILNILGIQAAENNARLKMIEKILGNDYDLDRLRELIKADREGRIAVFPCKPSDVTVYQLRNKKHAFGMGVHPRHVGCAKVWGNGKYELLHGGDVPCKDKDFGKTWFLKEDEAQAALKAMKEREEK